MVCLTPLTEIKKKSPAYWAALDNNAVPFPVVRFDIPDYGEPDDREAFAALVHDCANRLKAGGNLLVHCGAGIGRTGMLAECILLALGVQGKAARLTVEKAGAGAETEEQREIMIADIEEIYITKER